MAAVNGLTQRRGKYARLARAIEPQQRCATVCPGAVHPHVVARPVGLPYLLTSPAVHRGRLLDPVWQSGYAGFLRTIARPNEPQIAKAPPKGGSREADADYCLRRRDTARPARLSPRSAKVPGSGTAAKRRSSNAGSFPTYSVVLSLSSISAVLAAPEFQK